MCYSTELIIFSTEDSNFFYSIFFFKIHGKYSFVLLKLLTMKKIVIPQLYTSGYLSARMAIDV